MSRTEEGYARTLLELRAEGASALGRLGRTLDATLDELRAVRHEMRAQPRDRDLFHERHASLLARARLYRYFLEVQREAMGLRDHRDLNLHYPPPEDRA